MSIEDRLWRAVIGRDGSADGRFVYAVVRTGVFCRPSCGSRRPKREGVRFYADAAAAQRAGFRACKRCRPADAAATLIRQAVTRACAYLERHSGEHITLKALARQVGYSPFHLQRAFVRIVGISPREYAEARRVDRFKAAVRAGARVPAALYEAGYGSSSRLYEKAAAVLGMTPAAYSNGARGMRIWYTIQSCSLGRLLVAATDRGVCAVKIGDRDEELTSLLQGEFGKAEIRRDDERLNGWIAHLVDAAEGSGMPEDVPLAINGTAFQRKVWKALQAIPRGRTKSYGEIARAIGRPTAARAVARACATNPVALAIPCHRVVQGNGGSGGYHWGVSRKLALLAAESTKPGKSM